MGWKQGITKFCGRNVLLPAADDQQCSTPTRGDYARLGLVRMPSRWSATIFVACISLRDRSHSFLIFSIFSIFQFWIPRQAIHQHRLIPLISGPQSSLTMVDRKHRSLFRHGFLTSLSLHRYRSLLDLRRRKAWHLHAACKHGHIRWSRMGRGQWTF